MYDWHRKPGVVCLTSGVGYGATPLSAFDAAELDANIRAANAIKASSFIPPHWRIITTAQDLGELTDGGAFLSMAHAHAASNTSNVAASLVVGVNKDNTNASIIGEDAERGSPQKESLQQSRKFVIEAFENRGGVACWFQRAPCSACAHWGFRTCS